LVSVEVGVWGSQGKEVGVWSSQVGVRGWGWGSQGKDVEAGVWGSQVKDPPDLNRSNGASWEGGW